MSRHHDLAIEGRIRVTGKNVLLHVLKRPKKSTSGLLHVPGTASGRPDMARVLRLGPECSDLSENEIVKFNPYKLLLVLEEGGMAHTPGTPYVGEDEIAIVHQDTLSFAVSAAKPRTGK